MHRLGAVGVADHGFGARIAATGVDDIEAEHRVFGRGPERVGKLLLGAVLGDSGTRRLRQLLRVVRFERREIGIDETGEAGSITRPLRAGGAGHEGQCKTREH